MKILNQNFSISFVKSKILLWSKNMNQNLKHPKREEQRKSSKPETLRYPFREEVALDWATSVIVDSQAKALFLFGLRENQATREESLLLCPVSRPKVRTTTTGAAKLQQLLARIEARLGDAIAIVRYRARLAVFVSRFVEGFFAKLFLC